MAPEQPDGGHPARWPGQVESLAQTIELLTGNDAHVVDASPEAMVRMLRADDPLIDSWRAEALHLVGEQMLDLLRGLRLQAGLPLAGLR